MGKSGAVRSPENSVWDGPPTANRNRLEATLETAINTRPSADARNDNATKQTLHADFS